MNVHIELTDKCNALCSMCGRQYIENGELKKYLPLIRMNYQLLRYAIFSIIDFLKNLILTVLISVVILVTLLLAWIYALL